MTDPTCGSVVRCPDCNGTGQDLIPIDDPHETCEACGGSGAFDLGGYLDELAKALRGYRFNYSDERELQEGLARALKEVTPVEFTAEHSLTKSDRIDFYAPLIRVGIECKVKGSFGEIARQVHRYLQHPQLDGLVLISRRANVEQIPTTINSKPVRIVTLWSTGL